ncbi:MAG: hypothetical protein LBD63_02210, partial [Mycoplasmataceae bacterium]|nr:hypothetical protein [Mycoplasmataceae bacterium]
MSYHFFPINYKPDYPPKRTQVYISDYIELLNANIQQKLNGIYIQPATICNVNGSWNAHKQNERYISFDNKYTNEVSEILLEPGNYMRYALTNFDNADTLLYTAMTSIKRDAQEKDGEIMTSFNYYIEYRLVNESNRNQQVVALLKNILTIINAINHHQKFNDISTNEYIHSKINFISVYDLEKQYPTIPLNEALSRYVVSNGLTFIDKIYQHLPKGKRLSIGSPTADDYDQSGILYVFNKVTDTVIPIIKISVRPTQEVIKKQIIQDTPGELEEQIYRDTILNSEIKFLPSIGIQIYFSHLMLINLSKMHLCEVIYSPCSPELIKYFKENEI